MAGPIRFLLGLSLSFLAFVVVVLPRPASSAIAVDGQLEADYGAATLVQTVQTGLSSGGMIPGDNTLGDLNFASGSELDAAYALVSGGTLRLFLSGNLALRLTMQQNDSRGHTLDVFFDTAPGGQNTLNGLGAGYPLNGMTLETGFTADYWLELEGHADQFSVSWFAGRGVIDSPGSGTFTSLGVAQAGGPGTIVGSNPFGIKVSLDNRNTGGVGFGCDAASGTGVTRGIEWEIPLAAIGSPPGCFRVMAIVRDGSTASSPVSNSVLAPVPVGTCPMGSASFVSFASIAGDQSFEACPSLIDVSAAGPSTLSLAFAGANPARGDRVAFRWSLPDASAGTLELFDLAGRAVRRESVRAAEGTIDLAQGRRLAPGLYWTRLTHAQGSVVRRICIID